MEEKQVKLSRREFMKGTAIGAAGIASLGILGACNASAVSQSASTSVEDLAKVQVPEFDVFASSAAEKTPIDMSAVTNTKEYDVVVVGAGTAGIPAALAAMEKGAKVAVLQKEATAVAQGRTGSGMLLEKSDDVGLLDFVQYTVEKCAWRGQWDLIKAYAYRSGEAVKAVEAWATEAGFPPYNTMEKVFERIDGHPATAYMIQFGPKPKTVGDAIAAMAKYAESKGVDIFYSTPGVQLVKEGQRVTGIVGKTSDGSYVLFKAKKGVILTTGDYQNNDEMIKRYCPDILPFEKKQFHKTGDGHLMGEMAGGVIEPIGHTKMVHDVDSGPNTLGAMPYLRVNMNGERFCNETYDFDCLNNWLRFQPDIGRWAQVFDAKYYDQGVAWGQKPPTYEELSLFIPGKVKDPKGVYTALIDTHECSTLDELAEVIGCPADKLKETISRYNKLCEQGADLDFGKDPKYMQPINTAPYYTVRRWMRVSAVIGGLMTNENAQCLDEKRNVIPGLYAAGNVGGQFYGCTDYPLHLNGLSVGRCYTFGFIAGQHAAMQE